MSSLVKLFVSIVFAVGVVGAQLTPAKAELPRTGATIDNGIVAVTQSDTWGGAVVSLKFNGAEFIDVHDAGRELHGSAFVGRCPRRFSKGNRSIVVRRPDKDAARPAGSGKVLRNCG